VSFLLTLRQKGQVPLLVALLVDGLAYGVRLLTFRSFYRSYSSAEVIFTEAGFALSLLILILSPMSLVRRWAVASVIGSLYMAYLWLCDFTWWVMVK